MAYRIEKRITVGDDVVLQIRLVLRRVLRNRDDDRGAGHAARAVHPHGVRLVVEQVGPLVRRAMEVRDRPLHLGQVVLERIEEPAGLQVLRGCADGDTLLLYDVPDAVSVRCNRSEAEEP